jgi:hypothetical protein
VQTERGVLRPVPVLRPPLRHGLLRKVDRLGMVRFGSGRYAVPEEYVGQQVEIVAHEDLVVIRHAGTQIVRHVAVGPGEVALGSLAAAPRSPARGVRPRTAAEVAFIGLGPPTVMSIMLATPPVSRTPAPMSKRERRVCSSISNL